MKWGSLANLVMPGVVPGIHVLAASKEERRGWPGRSPAMTKGESFSSGYKESKILAAFTVVLYWPLKTFGRKGSAREFITLGMNSD
jgi:hypothetical protein